MKHPVLDCSKTRRLFYFALIICAFGALSACAHQPAPTGSAGFFSGLLDGFTIVFSLIGSIFLDWRIYEFPNAGGWYDFGYVLGASMFLGGSGAGAGS